jgi:hypothetical protein
MGTITHHGWRKPGDSIPQATSIITGKNLRKNSEPAPPPEAERAEQPIAKQRRIEDR